MNNMKDLSFYFDKITTTKPDLPDFDEFVEQLRIIWDNRWLTNNGPFHNKLESALAEYLGVPYVSLFCNGTIALQTALKTLDISGEVITTPFTFPATVHSIFWNQCEPVFMERGTYSGGSAMLDQQWGLSGNTVFGTLVGTFEDKDELDKLRTYFKNEARSGEVALTAMDGLTICRAIGHSAFRVRDLLTEAWNVMRHKQSGRAGCPPRIWNT
jgi:hypothetical protein